MMKTASFLNKKITHDEKCFNETLTDFVVTIHRFTVHENIKMVLFP